MFCNSWHPGCPQFKTTSHTVVRIFSHWGIYSYCQGVSPFVAKHTPKPWDFFIHVLSADRVPLECVVTWAVPSIYSQCFEGHEQCVSGLPGEGQWVSGLLGEGQCVSGLSGDYVLDHGSCCKGSVLQDMGWFPAWLDHISNPLQPWDSMTLTFRMSQWREGGIAL